MLNKKTRQLFLISSKSQYTREKRHLSLNLLTSDSFVDLRISSKRNCNDERLMYIASIASERQAH